MTALWILFCTALMFVPLGYYAVHRRVPGRAWLAGLLGIAACAAAAGAMGLCWDWLSQGTALGQFVGRMLILLMPLAALAYVLRVFPHMPLVILLLVPGLLSFSLLYDKNLVLPLYAFDGLLLAVALADLFTLPGPDSFSVERQTGRIASLRKPHAVSVTLSNLARTGYYVWVRDDVPPELCPQPDTFQLQLVPRSRAVLRYTLQPSRRGAFQLRYVHVRGRSRLGLWQRLIDYPLTSGVNVYPDLKQIGEYALLARTNRLSLMGVRRTRRIGQDNEFERLRDFTLDDNYKHIDWRSTARRLKLTVRDFQANQSQRVVFLVDCGRMMTNQAAGLSLLDHSLNAMLMLSYVALSHGDSVGLLCFSDEIHCYVPPTGGMRQMNRLLHAVFDRFPRLVESRYEEAFVYLAAHCRKRALVVLLTNLIDEVNAHQVSRYLRSFVGRNLPLGVWLRDRRLFEAADVSEPHGPALFRAAAAADIIAWRHQVLVELVTSGVLAIDTYPEQLTAPLVNRYLEIKARHLL